MILKIQGKHVVFSKSFLWVKMLRIPLLITLTLIDL